MRKFEEKQVRYVRYLPDKSNKKYLNWQHVYNTDDRAVSGCMFSRSPPTLPSFSLFCGLLCMTISLNSGHPAEHHNYRIRTTCMHRNRKLLNSRYRQTQGQLSKHNEQLYSGCRPCFSAHTTHTLAPMRNTADQLQQSYQQNHAFFFSWPT